MKSKWRAEETTIAGVTHYTVYRLIDVSGPEKMANKEVRGGYWTTRAEAERLAENLNREDGWND